MSCRLHLMERLAACLGSTAAVLLSISGAAYGQDGVERWRLLDQDGSLTLFRAMSDETDDYGSPSFSCRKGSGIIEAGVAMAEKERRALADMIANDRYPKLSLVPPDPQFESLPQLVYAEIDGWYYRFSISADAKAFGEFTRTGTFKFELADAIVATSFDVGLDNAIRFHNGCRKVEAR
jgi:hypothetical protein